MHMSRSMSPRPLPVRWTLGGRQFWTDFVAQSNWRVQRHVYTGKCRLLNAGNQCVATGSHAACMSAFEGAIAGQPTIKSRHVVILVHGIARSRASLNALRSGLCDAGFRAETFGYASTRKPIAEHVKDLRAYIENLPSVETVSFVTHSMGALIVRALLTSKGLDREDIAIRKFVMIAPPNNGSRIADLLQNNPLYRYLYGPAGQGLVPDRARTLPLPNVPFGVISGGREGACGFNPFLARDNDGTVTVAETRLPGAQDNLIVPAIHWGIPNHPDTLRATIEFLKTGRFSPRATSPTERR